MKLVGVLTHYNDARGFGYIRRNIDASTVEFYWLHTTKIVAGRGNAKKGAIVYFEPDPAYVVPQSGARYPWAYRAIVEDSAFAAGAAALATGLPSEDSDEQ